MQKNIPISIACIGEAMIEMSFTNSQKTSASIGVAGDTLNTAIYLRRALDIQYDVSFITKFGEDSFSKEIINYIEQEDVSTKDIRLSSDKIPGLYAITTDSFGERSFTYWRNDSAAKQLFNDDGSIDFSFLNKYDVIYFTAITLAILPSKVRDAFIDWLPSYKQLGNRQIVFDSNYRPKLWTNKKESQKVIENTWKQADVGLPSIDDEMALFDDANEEALIERFRSYNLNCCVLKRGSEGPININDVDFKQNYSIANNILDSTAAGDSFNAGFLGSYLTGHNIAESMLSGHNLAAEVVCFNGAITPKK